MNLFFSSVFGSLLLLIAIIIEMIMIIGLSLTLETTVVEMSNVFHARDN